MKTLSIALINNHWNDISIIQTIDGLVIPIELHSLRTHYDELILKKFSTAQQLENISQSIISEEPKIIKLTLLNNEFGGSYCMDVLFKLLNYIPSIREVVIDDPEPDICLTNEDEARLITYIAENPHVRIITPETIIQHSNEQPLQRIKFPYCLYPKAYEEKLSPGAYLLKYSFSCKRQQRSQYTCGPAALLMIIDYFHTHATQLFCNEPVDNLFTTYNELMTEEKLAQQLNTSERLGSDIECMHEYLTSQGFHVFGLSRKKAKILFPAENYPIVFKKLKELLIKLKKILDEGIPVLLNTKINSFNDYEYGHFCNLIAVEPTKVILADPGARFTRRVAHEEMNINDFVKIWLDSQDIPGLYLIIFPNKASKYKCMNFLE